MEDERIVPALVSVYKAEAWHHLGFCGNLGSAACRVPYEKPSRWAAAAFYRVGGVLCSLGGAFSFPPLTHTVQKVVQ